MEIDEILIKYVGEIGKYQILLLLFASSACINSAFNLIEFIFTARLPEYWCNSANITHLATNLTHNQIVQLVSPAKGDGSYDSCQMFDRNYASLTIEDALDIIAGGNISYSTVPCVSWSYSKDEITESIISEWDLVCDRYWLVATSQTIYFAGGFTLVFGGWLSDRFGRKPVVFAAVVGCIIARIVQGLAPNYYVFAASRFVLSATSINLYTLFFVMGVELVGPKWRVLASQIPYYFWSIGFMILPGAAYFIRDWRTLSFALVVFILPYLLQIWLLPESVRWLHSQNEDDAVVKVLNRMAKSNGKDVSLKALNELVQNGMQKKKTTNNGAFRKLLKSRKMLLLTLLLCFIWFSTNLVYYGLIFYLPNLGGNIYISTFLSGGLEIPAVLYAQLTLNTRLGRRLNTSLTFFVSGISLFALMAIPRDYTWINLSLALLGRFAIAATYAIIYVHTSEIYPTVLRGSGLSFCSTASRIASLIAPQVAVMGNISPYLPPSIFGVLSIVAGILSLLLPETRGQMLPDNIIGTEDNICSTEEEPNGLILKETNTPVISNYT